MTYVLSHTPHTAHGAHRVCVCAVCVRVCRMFGFRRNIRSNIFPAPVVMGLLLDLETGNHHLRFLLAVCCLRDDK
jgi:hypothetical protein